MEKTSSPKVRSVSNIGMSVILASISLLLIVLILPVVPYPFPGLVLVLFIGIFLVSLTLLILRKTWGYPPGAGGLFILFLLFSSNILDSLTRPGAEVPNFILSLIALVGTPVSIVFGIQGFRESRGKVPAGPFRAAKMTALALIVFGIVLGGMLTATFASTSRTGGSLSLSGPPDTTLSVEEKDMGFVTKEIKVKTGNNILIIVKNSDASVHTFTVDELSVNVENPASRTSLVGFKADRAGTFKFYCSIPGHREGGMEGVIVVAG